jgi:hypothetical protein
MPPSYIINDDEVAGHVECTAEIINAYKIYIQNLEGKRPLKN